MGGMVGQWLGANATDRFDKIVLANTTCYFPDPTRFQDRIKTVTQNGMASIADAVMASWLTEDFREREPCHAGDPAHVRRNAGVRAMSAAARR